MDVVRSPPKPKVPNFAVAAKSAASTEDARRLISGYVEHYNAVRLHCAIGYVTPKDKLEGREREIFEVRDRKLEAAHEARKERCHNKIDKEVSAMMN